jgi:hypothetical protein
VSQLSYLWQNQMLEALLNFIVWDPVNAIFTIPGTNRPVVWYGVLFAKDKKVDSPHSKRIVLI